MQDGFEALVAMKMNQISLVHSGFELVTKRTRKREFLDEMRNHPDRSHTVNKDVKQLSCCVG